MRKLLIIAAPIAIVIVCIVGAVLIATSGDGPEEREPEQAALPVDVMRPEVNQGRFTVRAQGTVSPRIQTELVSEVAGKVVWMSEDFVAGGTFEAGDALARIDPSDYETALLAAEAELAAARATLADEQARSDAAREDFRRLHGDSREPGDLLLRLPQVARAEAAVQAQEAAVERARRNLERTRITLPFSGMIRERSVDLGQYVNIGSNLGLAFSTDRAEIRLPLAESDLAFLGLPMSGARSAIERPVTLTGSVAGQAANWDATLVRTEGVVDSDTRLTYVVAVVSDPYAMDADAEHQPLPVGTFVTAEIPGRDASGLVVLPAQALHDENRVYVVDDDEQLEIRKVEVVRTTARRVYVSGPVSGEDRVITTAIPAPVPGLKLNVRESSLSEPGLRILPADEELAANGESGDAA